MKNHYSTLSSTLNTSANNYTMLEIPVNFLYFP